MKKLLYIAIIILLTILTSLIYSRFIGTIGLKTNEIQIETKSIKESYNGLKIIHFSDIHYKKVITNKRVKKLISEINKSKPDIILFTGDLIDKEYKITDKNTIFLINELKKLKTTYGKYAIIGDNDQKNIDIIKNIYIQSDFKLLNNEETIIYNSNNDKISILGINTLAYNKKNINNLINNTKEDTYKIVLLHEPDYINEITQNNNIDLILSGHSINGSINIPLIKKFFLPIGAKKYYKPYYKINNTTIYISNGIGVNNINFRLFNHPSINFYRFKTK